MNIRSIWLLALVLATHNVLAQAQSPVADSAAATATVSSFHAALARGDSDAALRLLAPDAVILENGSVETREEYRSHHLPADMEFAQAVPARQGAMQVTVSGDVAWVSSSSVTKGTFHERAINSAGAELMVLSRTAAGWVIRAIHWSSRTLRSGG